MSNPLKPCTLCYSIAVMLVGSAFYALAIYLTAVLNLPGSDNVQFRPGVVIPVVWGVLFGPAAGFVSGFLGNLAADQLLGWGWWPFWYLGNGLMGWVSGLFLPCKRDYSRLSLIAGVVARAMIGILVGMGLASVSERWITESSWGDILWVNFVPAVISNAINTVVLVPIVLFSYSTLWASTAVEEV